MAQYRSMRHPPRRAERHSSYRFLVTVLLTTTMVATGGFGTLPDNPVTQGLQEEIGENLPEPLLDPLNSYLVELSAPTIQPRPASKPNPPVDIIGFFLDDATSEPSIPVSIDGTGTEAPSLTSTLTETLTAVGTETITGTPTFTRTATSTSTVTPTNTATRTFTPTSTSIPTATPRCSAPSTDFVYTTFVNSSEQTIHIYWLDFSCYLIFYNTLNPGQSYVQGTYIGHLWQFKDSSTGALTADYVVSAANEVVDVSTGTISTATAAPAPTATTAPSADFYVSAVSLDGSGSVVTVPPGQPFTVTYDFQVFSDACPGCITQLITGLGFSGSTGEWCAYDAIPGTSPGAAGSEFTTLVAPSTPGTYSVVVEYHWQYTCADALPLYGGGGFVTSQVIGQVNVP